MRLLATAIAMLTSLIAAAPAIAPANDRPTTSSVTLITTGGWQMEVWIAGKHVGITPLKTDLPVGRVPFTAGVFGAEPLVDMLDIGDDREQVIALRTRAMRSDRLEAVFQRLVIARRIDPENHHIVLLSALLTETPDDLEGLVALLPPELHRHPNILMTRARFALRDERLDEALALANEVTRTNEQLATGHRLKARVLLRMNRLNEAIAAADMAIVLEPHNARNFSERGGIYLQQGKRYAASLDFERALELEPDNLAAKNGLQTATEQQP